MCMLIGWGRDFIWDFRADSLARVIIPVRIRRKDEVKRRGVLSSFSFVCREIHQLARSPRPRFQRYASKALSSFVSVIYTSSSPRLSRSETIPFTKFIAHPSTSISLSISRPPHLPPTQTAWLSLIPAQKPAKRRPNLRRHHFSIPSSPPLRTSCFIPFASHLGGFGARLTRVSDISQPV